MTAATVQLKPSTKVQAEQRSTYRRMSAQEKNPRSDWRKKNTTAKYGYGDTGIEELRGSVYQYGTQTQAERYLKTTKAIAEYVGKEHGKEMWKLINDKEETEFEEPAEPKEDASKASMEKYKMLLKMNIEDEKRYKRQKAKVFRIIMGQCQSAMRNKVESLPEYSDLEKEDDVIGLLTKMEELAYSTDNVQYEYWTMQASVKRLVTMTQDPKESLMSFSKRFLAQQEMTESVWGKLIPNKLKGQATDLQEKARDKYLACVFLAAVDRHRYKKAVDELNNSFLLGTVDYPEDVPGMLTLLSNRRGGGGTTKEAEALKDGFTATSFAQQRKKGPRQRTIYCYRCGKKGHISRDCPMESDDSSVESNKSNTSAMQTKDNKETERVSWSM